jgi:hypothetical protein
MDKFYPVGNKYGGGYGYGYGDGYGTVETTRSRRNG